MCAAAAVHGSKLFYLEYTEQTLKPLHATNGKPDAHGQSQASQTTSLNSHDSQPDLHRCYDTCTCKITNLSGRMHTNESWLVGEGSIPLQDICET